MKPVKIRWLMVVVGVLLCIGLLGITGCDPDDDTDDGDADGPRGEVTVALPNIGEEGFLPHMGASEQCYLWELVYDFLIYTDLETREPIPGLAAEWEYSDDYDVLTVWLREGVQWQDGWGEVTAEDVHYTFERIMEEGSSSPRAGDFRSIIDDIEIVDPYTLKFHLIEPDPVFWTHLNVTSNAFMPIFCKDYIEEVGDEEARYNPIGSGPYRLADHAMNRYVKFEALDEHWRVVPEFKYFTVRLIPEETTRVAMLRTGEIDAAEIDATSIAELEASGIETRTWFGSYTVFSAFGGMAIPAEERYVEGYHRQDPWVDIRVREAMSIAIDREAIAENIYQGAAIPAANHWLTPGWQDLEPIPYDPERAKQLLDDAGYPDGFSLQLYSYTQSPGAEMPLVNEVVAGYWTDIGLDVRIREIDFTAFRSIGVDYQTAGHMVGMRFTYRDDATPFLGYLAPGGPYPFFQDDELLPLINAIRTEQDYEKRNEYWIEASQQWRDMYVTIPIVSPGIIWGVNGDKIGEWPENMGRPYHFVYMRHAEPLGLDRLFTP